MQQSQEVAAMKTLEELRKQVPLTQEELARLCGVDDATIYRWEQGISTPRPANARKLAQVLGVTPSEVMQAFYVDRSEGNKERAA